MEIKISTRVPEEFSSDGIMLMLLAEELLLHKLFQELVLLELLENSLPNTNLLQFTSLIQHGEITTPSSLNADLMLESIDISTKRLRDSISKVWLLISELLLQDHALCSTPVLTTQPVLIQLLTNGNKLLLYARRELSTHSSIPLTKVSFPETSIKMEKVLDISSLKDSRWLLLNPSLKLWDFMEKEPVLFTSFAKIKLRLVELWVKSKLSLELTILPHQSTVQELLLWSLMTLVWDNNG